MQTTMITNVNIVENHFLQQDLWRNTSTQFMKAKKISNVNLVANYLLEQEVCRRTFLKFMKDTKIIISEEFRKSS